MSLNTGALVGVNAQTNGGRARNHGSDHRLRKAGQSADHACGNTACRAHAGAAADLVAHAHDVADDDVQKARGLHDADKEQNARHIGDHGVKARVDHLGDGHVGAAHDREARHQSRNRRADDSGDVDGSLARNHQEQRQHHDYLRNNGSCHFLVLWFCARHPQEGGVRVAESSCREWEPIDTRFSV